MSSDGTSILRLNYLNPLEKNLRLAGEVLQAQVEEVLDLWYGFVGSNSHLLYYFTNEGEPNKEYLEAVRKRFGQWILDLCNRPYDQEWLNYQHEIALRHHSTKKNETDSIESDHSLPLFSCFYLPDNGDDQRVSCKKRT